MTTVFKCDKCGTIMTYDDSKMLLVRVPDNEVDGHLCPGCSADVLDFANGRLDRQYTKRDRSGRFKK